MKNSFDLTAAKEGKPVQTVSGLPARIICFDRKHPTLPLLVLIPIDDKEEHFGFSVNGTFYTDESPCPYDLVMAPEKIELWANVYEGQHGDRFISACTFDSQSSALSSIYPKHKYINTIIVYTYEK